MKYRIIPGKKRGLWQCDPERLRYSGVSLKWQDVLSTTPPHMREENQALEISTAGEARLA